MLDHLSVVSAGRHRRPTVAGVSDAPGSMRVTVCSTDYPKLQDCLERWWNPRCGLLHPTHGLARSHLHRVAQSVDKHPPEPVCTPSETC